MIENIVLVFTLLRGRQWQKRLRSATAKGAGSFPALQFAIVLGDYEEG
jgi:hypothetical protein